MDVEPVATMQDAMEVEPAADANDVPGVLLPRQITSSTSCSSPLVETVQASSDQAAECPPNSPAASSRQLLILF